MIRLPAALLLSILVQSAHAQDARVFEVYAPPSGKVPVIVEFRDAPLFARGRERIAGDARQALEQRFTAFENDLTAIDRGLPAVTQRYSRVFAGTAVTVPFEAIARIRELDYVRAVHLDRPVQALLDASVPKIRGGHVWASFGTRGRDVVVAVIDTGIDYRHAAFDNGFGPGHRVAGGWDFVNDDPDPMDDDGHGTHVAGIVAGRGGDVIGVAPDATLLVYKVLDQKGHGMASTVVAGIERAADPNQDGNPDDHADVVNLSLGTQGGAPDDPMSRAVETATASGMLFCISAGNEGDFQTVGSPGVAPSAITVGASTLIDMLASFTSKGPVVQNFALKPEVVAPGEGILSARLGGGRTSKSGTSMAAPHVAGVAALLRAIHPDWTPAAVKAAIVGTAVPLGNEAMAEGAGRVDALNAATADVIALQGVLSLGATDGAAARYTPSATLTLVNRGTVARTLILKAPSPRDGITVTPDARGFVLAPGATRDVQVAFDVDNAKVPAPAFGSLAYSGAIQITGGAVPLRVPWAFVKGAPVTLDYDRDEPYVAFLSPTGTGNPVQIYADFPQRVQRLVPAATYDVVVFPSRGDHQRVIVVEQQVVSGTATTIAIRRDAAAHELDLRADDEHGAPIGNGRSCSDALVVLAPHSASASAFVTYASVPFLISTVSERFTLAPFTLCIAPGRTMYSGQFAPLRGIASPQSLVIRADEWSRTPLVVKTPPGVPNPRYAYTVGWARNTSAGNSFGGLGRIGPLNDSGWQSTLFLTPMRDPAIRASGKVAVWRTLEDDPQPIIVDSPAVQRSPEGIVVGGALTAAPVTYVAQPGEAITFGEGPMFASLALSIGDYYTRFGLEYTGALGEERKGALTGTSVVIRNSAGVLSSAAANDIFVHTPPDRYDVEVVKLIRLRDVDGTASLRTRFDMRLADVAPPNLTALRVLDALGFNASTLAANGGGTLLLSAIDSVLDSKTKLAVSGAIRTDSMRVQWRPHLANRWTPLAPSLVAEDDALGHPSVGSVYRADLAAVTQAGAGVIDLWIRFEDPAGNSYDWTLSPAFTVETPSRRPAARR